MRFNMCVFRVDINRNTQRHRNYNKHCTRSVFMGQLTVRLAMNRLTLSDTSSSTLTIVPVSEGTKNINYS